MVKTVIGPSSSQLAPRTRRVVEPLSGIRQKEAKSFSPNSAETFLYRKDDEDGKEWKVVSDGLPHPSGTTMSILASNQKVQGEFYAVNNHGVFISTDSGESWRKLTNEWPN